MKTGLRVLAALLLAAGTLAPSLVSPVGAATAGAVTVLLVREASVVGPGIIVGEVAEVGGKDAARAERVRKVPVGVAPPAGKTIRVTASMVGIALRKAGYKSAVVVAGEPEALVKTSSQWVETKDLLPLVKNLVVKETNEDPGDVRVDLGTSRKVAVPEGRLTTRVKPPASGRFEGSQLFLAEIRVDGRLVKTQPLRVNVEIQRSVLVATGRIERGDRLGSGNVEVRKLPASRVPDGAFTRFAEVEGREAGRMLTPGSPIRVMDLANPPVVRRGSTVSAIVRKNNIELAVDAKALDDGRAGQVIRIQNQDSGKIFKAKVLDEKNVEVVQPPKR